MILSDRELEILQLIAEGWSNRQIADHLYLSPHTVKNHVRNILKKMRVQRGWRRSNTLLKDSG